MGLLKDWKDMQRGFCKECDYNRRLNSEGLCFWCWDKKEVS